MGRARAEEQVERLRIIRAREELMARLRAGRKTEFLLREPSYPRRSPQVFTPRRGGSADARVELVVFHAAGCQSCEQGTSILVAIMKRYGDRVRLLAADHFAPQQIESYRAALALHCAEEQGKSWEMLLALPSQSSTGATDELVAAAGTIGIETEAFARCVAEDRYLPDIVENLELATRLGLARGLPAFFVNGVRLSELGNPQRVIEQIERAIALPPQ
jgi:protein-disulfide isomerase